MSDYTGNATELIIPSAYLGKPVVGIGPYAFEDCTDLSNIVIPNSVTSIGPSAFFGCTGLSNIAIPDSVTSIAPSAFFGCRALISIEVATDNANYQSIDGNLYTKDGKTLIRYACGKPGTTFTVPETVASIGEHAFSGCGGLTSVTIPDSVTSIGRSAFYGCTGFESIVIPDGVESIGSYVFYYCRRLTVYCEAASQPSGWDNAWNNSNRPVVWGWCGEKAADSALHTPVTDASVAPTCTATGLTEGSHCSVCSTVLVAQTTVPALGHNHEAAVTAPTCTEAGYTTYTCHCGDTYVADTVPALGHTPMTDPAVAPTCTETGFTEGSHCLVCKEVLVAQEVVGTKGHSDENSDYTCDICETDLCTNHSEEVIPAVAPTCTETGLTEGKKCSICGDMILVQETVPAIGHTPVTDASVAPTCTATGLTEGSHCSVCSTVLVAQTTVPALGHNHEAAVTAPTCTEAGYTTYTCHCGDTYVADTVSALGHTHVATVTAPTCTEAGYTTYTCHCGDTYVADTVSALGHSYSTEWSKDDTYHWHAATCGCDNELGSKGRHKWDSGVLQNAEGCSESAVLLYTCTECRATREEAATTHLYTVKEHVDATCSENGYTLYACSVCHAEELVVLYATGHEISYPTDDIEPTCTEDGMRAGICDYCEEYITISIDAKGHTPDEFVFVNECCGEVKLGTLSCSECGVLLASFGHDHTMTVRAATCTEEGARIYTCTLCGDTYEERMAAHGHDAGAWQVQTVAGCESAGLEVRICTICDAVTDERTIAAHGHRYASTAQSDRIIYACSVCGDSYTVITEERVTLSFVTDGGIICAPLTVKKGEVATLPIPEREGYTLIGWYFDEACENRCTSDHAFAADTVLYAAWAKAELSGTSSTNNIYTNAPLDFTFRIVSEHTLTDASLAQYLRISDRDGTSPAIRILATEGNTYTIGGEYAAGMTYTVLALEGVSFADTVGNEMWFLTEHESTGTVQYRPEVLLLPESELYSFYEDAGEVYLMFRRDLLDVGDIAVIYGDSTDEILLLLEVMAEGRMDTIAVYRIEAPNTEDVFAEYEVYYEGNIDTENLQFADDLAEELTKEVMASPMYAQFERAARTFAYGVTVGSYYYDFNGINVKPNFKVSGTTVSFTIKVTAEFARMHTETREVEGILNVTLEFKTDLAFSATVQTKSIDNFSFILHVKNNTNIKLFASLGDKGDGQKELSHFKNLFLAAKEDGEIKQLDASYAKHEKELKIAKTSFNFYGVIFSMDITNVFNFSVVGELGLEVDLNCVASFGVKRANGNFSLIKSFDADATITFWMLGKIEVSDTVRVRATLSLFGIANAYIDASVSPYFEVAGMLYATYTTGQGGNAVLGGYLELGVKVNATAGANAGFDIYVIRWKKWWFTGRWEHVTLFDKKWTLLEKNYTFLKYGDYDLLLSFKVIDAPTLSANCGQAYDLNTLVDRTVLIQNLKELTTREGKADCKYYLLDAYPGISLSETGILRVDASRFGTESREVRVKVVSGDIRKVITLTVTPAHAPRSIAAVAPTCTETGLAEGSGCSFCGVVLVEQEVIPALGHSPIDAAVENTVSPTCTEAGSCESVIYCGSCNAELSRDAVVVDALGHDEVYHPAVAPTCTGFGRGAYTTCTRCEYRTPSVEIFPLGHDEIAHSAKAPTCTEIGWHAYVTCSRCDYTTYEEKAALGHNYQNGKCTHCGDVSYTSEGLAYKLRSDGTYSVDDIGSCTDTDIAIPSTYNGKAVTSIGDDAFRDCTGLTSIVIPDSVTSIGDCAFEGCTGLLRSVTVGNGVESIGWSAFSGCTGLTSIVIPDSVTSIDSYAFSGCTGLTSITLPFVGATKDGTSNTHFGYLFGANESYYNGSYVPSSLKAVVITGGINIGLFAFDGCTGLTSITIPDSVTSIGSYAFRGCTSLTSVTIPDSVTSIGDGAFSRCTSLTSVVIPDSVTTIGGSAFKGCTGLTSVTFINTTGWKADGTALSTSDLANTSTAATYLKSTYLSKAWTRE